MKKRIQLYKQYIQARSKLLYKKVTAFVDRRPLVTFFILLALLLALIALGNFLRQPNKEKKDTGAAVKTVDVYRIGSSPKVSLQAQVEKSGVITITALSGGVVQKINYEPGDHVVRGNVLVNLSTNYQGGNVFSAQREIAALQHENAKETLPLQKDLINKQREAANKSDENSDRLREISAKTISDTNAIISLNDDILTRLNEQLKELESHNPPVPTGAAPTPPSTPEDGLNDNAIIGVKGQQSQLMGANVELRNAVRNTEYSSGNDNPPARLSELTKEIALKQLEIQEKALDLNNELSRLSLQMAYITEALMYPSSPFSGTVQKVFVKFGEAVSPGTPLMVLSQDIEDDPIVAIAYAPREIAQKVSYGEPSILHIDNFKYEVYPSYITQDAVQGSLYAIYFPLPDNFSRFLTEKGYIRVDLPIGGFDTSATIPFIPIDVVYQTQEEAYIFVARQGQVESRTVKLGNIYGRFVQIESGLKDGDVVILDRNVIAGESVKIRN